MFVGLPLYKIYMVDTFEIPDNKGIYYCKHWLGDVLIKEENINYKLSNMTIRKSDTEYTDTPNPTHLKKIIRLIQAKTNLSIGKLNGQTLVIGKPLPANYSKSEVDLIFNIVEQAILPYCTNPELQLFGHIWSINCC